MSDPYQEAFEDVLQRERERRAVWVVGLSSPSGQFGYHWAALLGVVVSESTREVTVKVACADKPWVKKPTEVYTTKEEAHRVLKRMWKDQADSLRAIDHAIRQAVP